MASPTALHRIRPRADRRDGLPYRQLTLHVRVFLRRGRLDRRLAEFADPAASPELGLRARQLTRPRHRRELADSVDEVISRAERPRPLIDPAIPIARREVRAARAALLGLSQALRGPADVAPAGVALALRLLTDGAGPLYMERVEGALWDAASRATAALLAPGPHRQV